MTDFLSEMSMVCISDVYLSAATKYLELHPLPIDQDDFDKHCGVGMSRSPRSRSTSSRMFQDLALRLKNFTRGLPTTYPPIQWLDGHT